MFRTRTQREDEMAMSRSKLRGRRAVILGSLAVAVLAPASAAATTAQAKGPLSAYLIQKGEATGFAPKRAKESTNLPQALKKIFDEKGKAYRRTRVRLEAEGWEGVAYEPLKGEAEAKSEGISTVQQFATPAGAEAEMRFELKSDTSSVPKGTALSHLKVAGIPHLSAFTFTDEKTGEAAADALFVEGQCFFVVGDFKPSGKQVAAPVIAGVRAIRKRTNAECP